MNLHGIVSGAIAVVNPNELVTLKRSNGYSTADDGTQVPLYLTPISVLAQVQAMEDRDLRQIEGLNLQGTYRKVWFFGDVAGVIRDVQDGGDLFTRTDGTVWLVTKIVEQWPDWCSLIAALQNGA